jgi:hypothetical protein
MTIAKKHNVASSSNALNRPARTNRCAAVQNWLQTGKLIASVHNPYVPRPFGSFFEHKRRRA